ncbi:MAG: VOC family protein [Desulfobacterales bacterium]
MMKTKEDDYGSFAGLVVRDADLMLGFYQNVLGMKLVHTDDGDEGLTKYYLTYSGGMLKLFAYDEPPELNTTVFSAVTGYRLNTYLVTNMAELFKALEDNEVKIVSAPQPTGNGQTWMMIEDPEGNMIEMAGTG